MKKTLLPFGIMSAFALHSYAQEIPAYQRFVFSNETSTYTALPESATLVDFPLDIELEETFWDDALSAPIAMPFPFTYQNVTVDNFIIDTYGGLIFNEIENDADFQVMGLCMDYSATEDRGTVSYETTGDEGSRILKIEFKNVSSYENYTGNDTFNFQIWLYETTNVIETRAGYSNVPEEFFVSSILDLAGEEPKEILVSTVISNEGDILAEDANDLYLHHVKNVDDIYADEIKHFPTIGSDPAAAIDLFLGAYPATGTIFRYTPIIEGSGIEKIATQSINVFPNPASNGLNITFSKQSIETGTYQIFDMYGREITHQPFNGKQQVDIQNLPSGQYILKVSDDTKSGIVKFVKL